MSEDGQEICNYPEWTTECNAFSLWMDWQSDDGERLHDLVDNTIIPDDFTGKFRIGICGQNITIGFNNKNDIIKAEKNKFFTEENLEKIFGIKFKVVKYDKDFHIQIFN